MPLFLVQLALKDLPENPYPGKDGTITSKASSSFPPNFSGCASWSIICKNSTIDPGHPWFNNNGFGFDPLPFS